MGGDGGTVATQRKFVRSTKTDDKDEKNITQDKIQKAHECAISKEKLKEPIVCCELGNLYNKEAILSALIEKNAPIQFSHIRGLKDLKNLKLMKNPNYSTANENDGKLPAMFICPVTKVEFNGIIPFIAIWTTGYVLSDKAIREIGIENLQEEYGPFNGSDLIPLISSNEELLLEMKEKILKRRENKKSNKSHSLKDIKKDVNCSSTDKRNDDDHPIVTNPLKKIKSEVILPIQKNQTKLDHSKGILQNVMNTIKTQQEGSRTYKGLFHKDSSNPSTKSNDLFIAVAGLRYTLH